MADPWSQGSGLPRSRTLYTLQAASPRNDGIGSLAVALADGLPRVAGKHFITICKCSHRISFYRARSGFKVHVQDALVDTGGCLAVDVVSVHLLILVHCYGMAPFIADLD